MHHRPPGRQVPVEKQQNNNNYYIAPASAPGLPEGTSPEATTEPTCRGHAHPQLPSLRWWSPCRPPANSNERRTADTRTRRPKPPEHFPAQAPALFGFMVRRAPAPRARARARAGGRGPGPPGPGGAEDPHRALGQLLGRAAAGRRPSPVELSAAVYRLGRAAQGGGAGARRAKEVRARRGPPTPSLPSFKTPSPRCPSRPRGRPRRAPSRRRGRVLRRFSSRPVARHAAAPQFRPRAHGAPPRLGRPRRPQTRMD